MKLVDLWRHRNPNPEDEEQALEKEAATKKARADHLERMAKLHKEIAGYDKRIKESSAGLNGLLGNKRVLIGAGILIIVVIVIAKSCGG
jgi:hypothetical protein